MKTILRIILLAILVGIASTLAGCGEIKVQLPNLPQLRPTPIVERGIICTYTCEEGVVVQGYCGPEGETHLTYFPGDPCPCRPDQTFCGRPGVL